MNPAEFANIAKAEQTFWWYRGMNRILFRVLDSLAREGKYEHVLEAGCGTGYLSRLAEQRYGWRMTPVDLGWEGLRYARAMGLDRLAQADIARLPFSDATFDCVLSMDVIVHFPRGGEGRAFAELARVLKAGGDFVVRVSALDSLRSRHSTFAHERQRFTRGRLVGAVEECGVEVRRCTYINSLLAPVAFAKFRLWEPLFAPEPASGVEPVSPWLNFILEMPLRMEAAWVALGGGFPAGQSLLLVGRKG